MLKLIKRVFTRKIILWLMLLCIATILMAITVELFPRYITYPILPPDYYKGDLIGDWDYTTYSIIKEPNFARTYVWRVEASVVNDEATNYSWQSIISYFDDELARYHWKRQEEYASCELYMPEARFLDRGVDGYVYYKRSNIDISSLAGALKTSHIICLSVWQVGEKSFYVVLQSARPSLIGLMNYMLSW